MDIIFEFLFELIFDGCLEIAKSKKISKWIRYPLIVIIILYILAIFGLIGYVGVAELLSGKQYGIYFGVLLLTLDIFLIVSAIIKVKNIKK